MSQDKLTPAVFTSFGLGYQGSSEEVSAMISNSNSLKEKTAVIHGGMKALEDGRPENLKAAFAAFAERKAGIKDTSGYTELLTGPATAVIEKSASTTATANLLVSAMQPEARQVSLDMILLHAAANSSPKTVEAVLEAGANPNTDGGRAVDNARKHLDYNILRILHKHGADLEAAGSTRGKDYLKEMEDLHRLYTQEEKAAAFKQQATELAAQVEKLQAELKKYAPAAAAAAKADSYKT